MGLLRALNPFRKRVGDTQEVPHGQMVEQTPELSPEFSEQGTGPAEGSITEFFQQYPSLEAPSVGKFTEKYIQEARQVVLDTPEDIFEQRIIILQRGVLEAKRRYDEARTQYQQLTNILPPDAQQILPPFDRINVEVSFEGEKKVEKELGIDRFGELVALAQKRTLALAPKRFSPQSLQMMEVRLTTLAEAEHQLREATRMLAEEQESLRKKEEQRLQRAAEEAAGRNSA